MMPTDSTWPLISLIFSHRRASLCNFRRDIRFLFGFSFAVMSDFEFFLQHGWILKCDSRWMTNCHTIDIAFLHESLQSPKLLFHGLDFGDQIDIVGTFMMAVIFFIPRPQMDLVADSVDSEQDEFPEGGIAVSMGDGLKEAGYDGVVKYRLHLIVRIIFI